MNVSAHLLKQASSTVPYLRMALTIFMSAAIGWLLAKAFWLIVEPGGAVSRTIPMQNASTNISSNADRSLRADLTVLTRETRFGDNGARVDIMPDAPVTTLNLRLKGVRSVASGTDEENNAIAIILTPDNRSSKYGIGDTIIEGVTLQKVFQDRVLLNRRGESETLFMESSSSALAVLSRSGEEGLIEGKKPKPGANVTPNNLGASASKGAITPNLINTLKFEAVFDQGDLQGYRLNTSANPSGFAAAGLQQNDVITGINGQSVTESDVQTLLSQLSKPGKFNVTIIRNGSAQRLDLSLSEEN